MSKWQQVKTLMRGLAYFGTGIVLIIGSLVMLGVILEALTTSYYTIDGQMPVFVKWTPLFIMLVAIGWGAYFINKGINIAGRLFFYLLGETTCKILQLHRLPHKVAFIFGGIIALAGLVIICVEFGSIFIADELTINHPTVALIGIVFIFLGIATVEYTAAKREQELATKL